MAQRARQQDWTTSVEAHAVREGRPIRRRHDDFVARVEGGRERIEDDAFGAVADEELVRCEVQLVFALQLARNGLAQGRHARRCGVLGVPRFDGGIGRSLDVVRSVEVGLSGGQVQDVAALLAQGDCLGLGRGIGRQRHGLHALGKVHGHGVSRGRTLPGLSRS